MELFCFSFPLFQLVKQENEKVAIWWTRQHGWFQRVFICSSLGTFHRKCILCSEMSSLEKFFFLAERWGFHWTGNERGRWLNIKQSSPSCCCCCCWPGWTLNPGKSFLFPDSIRFPRSLVLIFILSFHDHHHRNTKPSPNFSATLFSRLLTFFFFLLTAQHPNFFPLKHTSTNFPKTRTAGS